MAKLNYPSIVKFIGYCPTDFNKKPKPVIISEFLSNGSLEDILNLERKGLCKENWDDTRKLINIYGIAKAMSYLHAHNIIHRDLKPDNILMDDYLFPKITDFGLSKINDSKENLLFQSTATIKGTPVYLAPEIWSSYEYTNAGDVYAFAFIVYEIMTSEIPYKNCSKIDLAVKVTNNIRPEIIGIPESYQNLIERCWDQNPSKRPSFNDIVEELKNNPEFITDMMESTEYEDYIDFIENCEISFDSEKSIKIGDFDKQKQRKFQKVIIDKSLINNTKDDDESNSNDDEDDSDYEEESEDDDDEEDNNVSKNSNKNDSAKKGRKITLVLKTKKNEEKTDLPFALPPCDPTTEKFRKIFIDKIKKSPKEEISNIIFTYAVLTQLGKQIPKNINEAGYFFKIAADMGHMNSMWHYAIYLHEGIGIPVNIKESYRYLKMAIEKGSSDAMLVYANYLENEEGSNSKQNSIKYYEMAAERGQVKAMKQLYLLYLGGDGVEQDLKKSFRYCKMAADLGDSDSLINLGHSYCEGIGTEQNYDAALKVFHKAADQ